MIAVIACILAAGVVAFVLGIRTKDLPQAEAESPFAHLDERKAAIYENLRDLQFEYRVGKLSDQDYQNTKKDLQKELAAVLGEVDRMKERIASGAPASPKAPVPPPAPAPKPAGFICPACGARFENALKFCGECGKPMKAEQA